MNLRLICRVADQYVITEYESSHTQDTRIKQKAEDIIRNTFDKYGLAEFIVTTYREESPFISTFGNGKSETVRMFWQEMVVCLNITDHVVWNRTKLKYPELVPIFHGEYMYLGENAKPMALSHWKSKTK